MLCVVAQSRLRCVPYRRPLPRRRSFVDVALLPPRRPATHSPSQNISEDNDSRVGSAQDGAEGGTVTKALHGSDSSSAVSLLSTFVPVLVYVAVCTLIFWVLRRRLPRVYRPRTMLTSLPPQCVLPAPSPR